MNRIRRSDIQGNILNGYNRYTHVSYLHVSVPHTTAARRLLTDLVETVTTADIWPANDWPGTALNVAISYAGFAKLGLPEHLRNRFPVAFREGTRARATQLGDTDASAPENWEDHYRTPWTDLMVTVHGRAAADRDRERDRVVELAGRCGGDVREETARHLQGRREHFGFADGAAQPDIEGVGCLQTSGSSAGGGIPLPGGRWKPIKLGEFVLGHSDEDGEVTTDPAPELTRNGSYLVFRKLRQDVKRFWDGLEAAAAHLDMNEELLAAKMVGRWRDGTPLLERPDWEPGDLSLAAAPNPSNDFRYLETDRGGYRCPAGAHIRRANPRDSLDFDGTLTAAVSGRMSARHRIIRRGMPYGPDFDRANPDNEDRGLIFVCFNADLARQFELLQARWCGDVDARGHHDNRDFVMGLTRGTGKVTVPMEGSYPRFVPVLQDVVRTRGAEYFFVPGIEALRRLAAGRFDNALPAPPGN